jgi:hypothetical protein
MPYDISLIPQEELEEFREIFKVVDLVRFADFIRHKSSNNN